MFCRGGLLRSNIFDSQTVWRRSERLSLYRNITTATNRHFHHRLSFDVFLVPWLRTQNERPVGDYIFLSICVLNVFTLCTCIRSNRKKYTYIELYGRIVFYNCTVWTVFPRFHKICCSVLIANECTS